jgi:heme-degrading monooxygenase HmoA
MVSRIVTCNVPTNKLNEFTTRLSGTHVPRIKDQPGFVDIIESVDPKTGKFVCMTLWRTPQDVDRYDKSLFQEIAEDLTPFLNGAPEVQTLNVENSTVHHIERGKAKAA